MRLLNKTAKTLDHGTSGIHGSILLPMEPHASRPGYMVTMITRFDSRLRILAEELNRAEKLLDEANKALAEAGVPYRQGNIRERISAHQVFRRVWMFPA